MEYTDTIKNLIKNYNLTPQEVFFSLLCSLGTGRQEAYLHLFYPKFQTDSALTTGAAKLVKEKPQILKLIEDLKTRNKIIPLSADLEITKRQKKKEEEAKAQGWRTDQTPEENLKRILMNELYKLEPGEKVKAAQSIAKLLGVKEDTRETRHYYLPISCKHCKLYIDAEDKNRKRS